jgi:hypothetical protein
MRNVMRHARAGLLAVAALALACGGSNATSDAAGSEETARPAGAEATSLLGKPLFPAEIQPETRARLEQNLAAAQAAYDHTPDNADSIIWLGRRLAYLGRFREAINVFTRGIAPPRGCPAVPPPRTSLHQRARI